MSPTTPETIETTSDLAEPADVHMVADEDADEGLHFGRAWHRYCYCFRQPKPLRVLVAGCGTGGSTAWAARLNPGASVLGIDASPAAVALARERAGDLDATGATTFEVHEPAQPLPESWGRFDFVVCQGLLAAAVEPLRLLGNLARALDPEGMLLVSIPSHSGRELARGFRRGVETLAPPGAGDVEMRELGLELFQSLRDDHPIRIHVARTHHDAERAVADLLGDDRDWTLDGAIAMLKAAGLKFLYAATPWRWRPDRVFAPDPSADDLKALVQRLAPDKLSRFIDALDPGLLDDHYPIHACLAGYSPPVPDWPVTRGDDPRIFEQLVPVHTGLVDFSRFLPSGTQGRVLYKSVSGTLGELDRWSHRLLTAVNGVCSCGEIERDLSCRARAGDDPTSRQDRWIDLADNGLILLRPPGL